jgi:Kef-type K+ transport system membrane component KefB
MAAVVDIISQSVFAEVAALLAIAAIVGFVGSLLRQPLIVSFIAVGLLAGPSFLDIARSSEQIELLSQLGIAILLFLVGTKLDVKLIRSLGAVSVMTGLGQVAFTTIVGFLIGLAFGMDMLTSLYVAVALTFSSTIIIVKLLSDKREIDSLHGQIALGFLIVQDLVVVFAMIVLSALGIAAEAGESEQSLAVALGSGVILVLLVILFVKYAADALTERLADVPELLIIFGIALAAMFAAIADFTGLGKEVGGLLAGVSLASTPYRETISARMAPLRDFLLLFFFIGLGATLDLSLLGAQLGAATAFSLFVLIGNPLIVLVIMGVMGYRKRTGFLAGLTVAQISEFSLIFIAMGVTLGHVASDAVGLVTMVGLVTIAVSTYMITYSHQIYRLLEPILGVFERTGTPREARDAPDASRRYDVIVFGLGRLGSAIGVRLKRKGLHVLGIDFNPEAVRNWRREGLEAEYGDAADPEFIAGLPLQETKWAVLAIPVHLTTLSHQEPRTTLLQIIRKLGYTVKVAVVSHMPSDTEELLSAGADMVLEPFENTADYAAMVISKG